MGGGGLVHMGGGGLVHTGGRGLGSHGGWGKAWKHDCNYRPYVVVFQHCNLKYLFVVVDL